MIEEFQIEICPPGTYSPGGTFAPRSGASVCYDCPKGHMYPRASMESEQCPLGTYIDFHHISSKFRTYSHKVLKQLIVEHSISILVNQVQHMESVS